VTTGFERDEGRGAARVAARIAQSSHLRMCLPGALMPALADHRAAAHQHASHARIGIGGIQTARSQLNRPRHVGTVFGR